MHFAVESRNPFLDYRLFNFILGHGVDALLHDGWSKYVLRQAMDGVIPEEVRTRTDKMGYDAPTGRLLRENAGAFRELLDRNGGDPLLNTAAIRRALDEGGIADSVLCSALSYLAWKEAFAIAA